VQYRLLELAHFGINVECHYTTLFFYFLGVLPFIELVTLFG